MEILAIIILLIAFIIYLHKRSERIQKEYLYILEQVYNKLKVEIRNASLSEFLFSIESQVVYKRFKSLYPKAQVINQTIKLFTDEYNKQLNLYIKTHKMSSSFQFEESSKITIKPYTYNIKKDLFDMLEVFSLVFLFTYPIWLGIFLDEEKSNHNYSCDKFKRYCSQMNSCSEAYFYMNECGIHRLDRDSDGIPCEKTLCLNFSYSIQLS